MKNVTHEIERKFLVAKLPENWQEHPAKAIRQGYIAITSDGTEVRLRQKGSGYFQTVKCGSGLQRGEVEIELSKDQFEQLWPLTEGMRIEKIRYEIAFAAMTIELDVFQGRLQGLMIAEVEFPSMESAQSFLPPRWLGKEVTDDERYKNRNLARDGIPHNRCCQR